MKILITGGLGLVGRPVVEYVRARGHQVRVVDRQAGECSPGVECMACDITDFAALRPHVEGMDAIIHLAAVPHPGSTPNAEIFRINSGGAFNVYEAAAQAGIRRVATASSINWLGYYYGIRDWPLRYFPIDEEHPNFTSDAYSFSKQTTEDIAAYYWRREGISSVCLRMPSVIDPQSEWAPRRREWLAQTRLTFQELLDYTETKRGEWLARLRQKSGELRAARWLELPYEERQAKGWGLDNPEVRLLSSAHNFWAVLDVRDAAQAFEKSLTAEIEGSHALYITQTENSSGLETEALARLFFPEVTARKRTLSGRETLVSLERAQALIGFEPQHSFS